jgi:membrane protein
MVLYLATVTQTPAGAAFGPILGLLIFIFTVSQFVLFPGRAARMPLARSSGIAYASAPPPAHHAWRSRL